MQKPLTIVLPLLAAGMMLLGNAPAQQTPAATTAQPTQPAKPSTPAKTATTAKKAPATTKAATPLTLKTQKDKISYALGMNIAAIFAGGWTASWTRPICARRKGRAGRQQGVAQTMKRKLPCSN